MTDAESAFESVHTRNLAGGDVDSSSWARAVAGHVTSADERDSKKPRLVVDVPGYGPWVPKLIFGGVFAAVAGTLSIVSGGTVTMIGLASFVPAAAAALAGQRYLARRTGRIEFFDDRVVLEKEHFRVRWPFWWWIGMWKVGTGESNTVVPWTDVVGLSDENPGYIQWLYADVSG